MNILDDREQLINHIRELESRCERLMSEHGEMNGTDQPIQPTISAPYLNIFNLNPLPMWIYDFNSLQFIDVNEAAIHHYGYSRSEFLQMSIRDIRPPEELARFDLHNDTVESLSKHHGYWRHLKKDGVIIHVEITAQLIDYDGRKATLVLSRDITSKVHVESRLIRSNRRLQAAQQIAKVGYWEMNLLTNELYLSDQAYLIFELKKTETPPDYHAFFNRLHKDSLAYFLESNEPEEQGDRCITAEQQLVLNDGSIKIISAKASLLHNEDGIPFLLEGIVQDITDRKKAEENILKKEKRFRTLIENSTDGITIIDANGIVMEISPSAERILGYDSQTIIGKYRRDLIHPDDQEIVIGAFDNILKNPKWPARVEYRHIMPDGGYKWLECVFHNLLEEPYLNAIVLNFRDVTERVNTEKIIRENERRMKNAQYIGSLGDWEYNCCTKKLIWSDEMFLLFARDPLLGAPPLEEFLSYYYPEDAARLRSYVVDAVENGTNYELDLRLGLPNKPDAYHHSIGQALKDEDGRIIRLYGIIQDITERKLAEIGLYAERNQLRTLINSLPDSIYIKDLQGRKTITNEIDMQLIGAASEEEVLGKTDLEIFPNAIGESGYEDDMDVIRTGNAIFNREECFIDENGSEVWLLTSKVPLRAETGEIMGLLGIGRIITARKLAEEALRESNERYVYATKATFDAIWDWDIVNDSLYWGEGYEKIFGYEITDKIENHIHSFDNIHPEDREGVFDSIAKLLAGADLNWTSEYRYRKANGEFAYVNDKGIIIRDEAGKAIRMIGAMQDMTERKLADEAIRRTQEKFTSLVNTIDGIVWEADAKNFAFCYVSKHAEELLGYPTSQWIEEPNFWANHIHPDDRDEAVTYCVNNTKQKVEHQFEYRMIAADGRVVWLCDFVTVLVEKGEPVLLRGVMVDITERKKAEEAIKESEEKYRFLFERSLAGVYQATLQGQIITCNEAFANIFGYSSQELQHENASVLYFDSSDREKFIDYLRNEGELSDKEIRMRHRDGSPVFLIENCLLLRDAVSHEEIIQGALIDITERKKAEEALVSERKLLRTLIDNLPDFIYVKDREARIVLNNKANVKDLGFQSEEEIVGKTIVDLLGEDFGGEFIKDDWQVLQSGEAIMNSEKLVVKGNGASNWLLTSKIPIRDEYNQVVGLVGINRDITERKSAEEALVKERKLLRILIDNLPDYIYVKDKDCRHIINNKANIELLGFQKEEDTINKTIVELLGQEVAGDFIRDDMNVIRSGLAIMNREEPITNIDGERRWMLTTKIPFKDDNNEVIGLVGISRDITERKEKDEELTEKNSQLKSLSKHLQSVREEERKLLAREVHDELGQLVSVVKMDIDWLRIRLPDLQVMPQKRLDHASATSDLLIQTIRKIASSLRPSMLDDFGLNISLAWQCKEFTSTNGIPCEFEQMFDDSELSMEVKTELFRICQESLTNVMRHAAATRVKVSIQETKDGLYLSIADNGKGFDTKRKTSTLGLIGMRERALSVNGKLSLKSVPGKGTSICAIIPKNNIPV